MSLIRSILWKALIALAVVLLLPFNVFAAEGQALVLEGFSLPGEWSKGQFVELTGVITSDSAMTLVSISINNEGGKEEGSATAKPDALTFDLTSIDEAALFALLSPGNKTLVIKVQNNAGEKTLLSSTFTVNENEYCFPVLRYSKISSRYGEYRGKANRINPYHYAIDIAAKKGTPIYACASGKVVDLYNKCKHRGPCGCGHDCGNHIEILSESGEVYKIRYSHMTTVLVKPGQLVQKGQKIGTVGNTGRSYGAHLDLKFIDADDQPINPEPYFNWVFR